MKTSIGPVTLIIGIGEWPDRLQPCQDLTLLDASLSHCQRGCCPRGHNSYHRSHLCQWRGNQNPCFPSWTCRRSRSLGGLQDCCQLACSEVRLQSPFGQGPKSFRWFEAYLRPRFHRSPSEGRPRIRPSSPAWPRVFRRHPPYSSLHPLRHHSYLESIPSSCHQRPPPQ